MTALVLLVFAAILLLYSLAAWRTGRHEQAGTLSLVASAAGFAAFAASMLS